MQEVDINKLVGEYNCLNEYIPNDIIIVGKINTLIINYKYNELDLSRLDCKIIKYFYYSQNGESIKNHILPNSLKELYCDMNDLSSLPNLSDSLEVLDCSINNLTVLPKLPNSLKKLNCRSNRLISLPDLPNLLIELSCYDNKLISLPDLPNYLEELYCRSNQLTSLPDLPNSLKNLYCQHNQLASLPNISHIDYELELVLNQDLPINYISYNPKLRIDNYNNKINIIDYPHNPITNQDELDKYMDYVKNYQLNKIKSARK